VLWAAIGHLCCYGSGDFNANIQRKSQILRRKTKIMDRIEFKAFVAEENNLHIHVQKTQIFFEKKNNTWKHNA
jgi:hypothetical protein